MIPPREQVTAQKYDLQFGTNVIGMCLSSSGQSWRIIRLTGRRCAGHWLFTQMLLSALFAATDASSSHEKARIVTVSSSANYFTTGLDFDAIVDGPGRTKYGEWELYSKSKFVRKTFSYSQPCFFSDPPIAG